jgi:hypothetical protein
MTGLNSLKSKIDMRNAIGNVGSVDDIRSSLALINPTEESDINKTLDWLRKSVIEERRMKNRASVIKMVKAKINVLVKYKKA